MFSPSFQFMEFSGKQSRHKSRHTKFPELSPHPLFHVLYGDVPGGKNTVLKTMVTIHHVPAAITVGATMRLLFHGHATGLAGFVRSIHNAVFWVFRKILILSFFAAPIFPPFADFG